MNAIVPYARLVDMADALQPDPSDLEVIMALSEAFDMSLLAVIERLVCVDLVAVRKQVSP